MIGKFQVKSYKAKSSRQTRKWCNHCRKWELCELVDYGDGGFLVFFACSNVVSKERDQIAREKEKT